MCLQAPYNVVNYTMAIGVDPKVLQYFAIDANAGVLYVRNSLQLDTSNAMQYGVR